MDGWHRAESQLCCYVTLGTLLRLFGSLFPVFSSAPCTRESYAIIDNLCNVSDREYTLKKKIAAIVILMLAMMTKMGKKFRGLKGNGSVCRFLGRKYYILQPQDKKYILFSLISS